ncbi:MAG: glycosyltransferase family 4 protein [Candidatus Nanopelagicales bacterium]|nr:glycosyltransferase family 4 protein [Candidatus Nanopelagicales bacterium]
MRKVLFGVTIPLTANAFLTGQMQLLVNEGWEVHLATSLDSGFDTLQEIPGVSVHAVPMRREPSITADLRGLYSWIRLLKLVQPDVTVVSTPKAGLLGSIAARLCRVPTRVYHIRGLRAEGLKGSLRFISIRSEKLAIKWSTNILSDSNSLTELLETEGLLKSKQAVVLGLGSACGVDTSYFRPPSSEEKELARVAAGFTQRDIVVMYLGRLAVDKGIKDLANAMQSASASNTNLKLEIVGPEEQSDKFALESTLQLFDSQPWAHIYGPVDDPRSLLWAADIFCLPSYREGFPISVLEAQACGLPVITTKVTGCSDSIVDNTTGILVEAKSPESLAKAILEMSSDLELRERLGTNGAVWVKENFDCSLVEQRFSDYLNRITN